MAQYKIQRKKGVEGSTVYAYTAPGHNECVPTRLHDPADVDGGKLIMGITYFVPGGGCDFGANPLESIYYILKGEMTLKTETEETEETEETTEDESEATEETAETEKAD